MTSKQKDLTKNFFALGLMFWLYEREPWTRRSRWIDEKFGARPVIAEANKRALKAGYAFGETTEIVPHPLPRRAGQARRRARTATSPATRRPRSASSPRRKLAEPAAVLRLLPDHAGLRHPPPAVGLQELRRQDVPGRGRDRGDRRGHRRGVRRRAGPDRARRGPGIALKAEAMASRSWSSCRSSSSTSSAPARRPGMPTKTEQADLLQVMFGRNGDSPMPDRRAGHARRLLRHGDRGVADRAQVHDPGRLPVATRSSPTAPSRGRSRRSTDLPDIAVANCDRPGDASSPYQRDPKTLARPWAVPGTPGLEHRIGGLEKADITGNVSYDPDNHHQMQLLRQAKVAGIADDIPPLEVFGPDRGRPADPRLGLDLRRDPAARSSGCTAEGRSVAHAHLRHLNPFPANTEDGPPELPPGADPGGQPRPAADADPGALPDRRRRLRPGPRQAVPDRGDRRRGRAHPRGADTT